MWILWTKTRRLQHDAVYHYMVVSDWPSLIIWICNGCKSITHWWYNVTWSLTYVFFYYYYYYFFFFVQIMSSYEYASFYKRAYSLSDKNLFINNNFIYIMCTFSRGSWLWMEIFNKKYTEQQHILYCGGCVSDTLCSEGYSQGPGPGFVRGDDNPPPPSRTVTHNSFHPTLKRP